MNNDKIHLINKTFNNETIRTVWDKESEKYYISVVDIVGVLSESNNPQVYWRVMKKRLAEKHKPKGLEQNKEVARLDGHAAKVARDDIERNLGESVVTKK